MTSRLPRRKRRPRKSAHELPGHADLREGRGRKSAPNESLLDKSWFVQSRKSCPRSPQTLEHPAQGRAAGPPAAARCKGPRMPHPVVGAQGLAAAPAGAGTSPPALAHASDPRAPGARQGGWFSGRRGGRSDRRAFFPSRLLHRQAESVWENRHVSALHHTPASFTFAWPSFWSMRSGRPLW